MRATLIATVLIVGDLLVANAARSQSEDYKFPGSGGDWDFQLTPYLFLPLQTKGTSTVAGQSADLDLSLSDVLKLLQGAVSLRFEGWKNRFGLIVDGYYVRIEGDGTLPASVVPLPGPLNLNVETKQSWATLLAVYRVAEGRTGAGRPFSVDVSAGAKYNDLRQEITLRSFSLAVAPVLGGTKGWWEPAVAIRGAVEVAHRWTLGARAEFGGFGVNGNDLSYLVLAGADWRAWESTSLRFGYQFYGIDYSTDNGTFAYDVDQNGFYLGATFRF